MDRLAVIAVVQWVLGHPVKQVIKSVMTIACMDERIGLVNGYKVQNAGPRLDDSRRSLLAFLRLKLKEDGPVVVLWLTHGGGCGCSKIECEDQRRPLGSSYLEGHTHKRRVEEIRKLLQVAEVAKGISEGKICFMSGHCGMNPSGAVMQDVSIHASGTNLLLKEAGLPTHAFNDNVVVNVPNLVKPEEVLSVSTNLP
ncbi:MAG: hypothetical protein IT292_06670 [Deltaproteobacteria bacterium]|nr:hypothetical protein [Deltaproteobacteria bacterium]